MNKTESAAIWSRAREVLASNTRIDPLAHLNNTIVIRIESANVSFAGRAYNHLNHGNGILEIL